jgi:hypothetical protein
MRRPRVEILFVPGCANRGGARELVEQVAAELRLQPTIELIEVPDGEAAARLRFLGSPTVRVDGRDVERGAEDRTEFVLACRLYRTAQGLGGQPDAGWIRAALSAEAH